jgi:branched-chain amino acid transport system substrate-binding protein
VDRRKFLAAGGTAAAGAVAAGLFIGCSGGNDNKGDGKGDGKDDKGGGGEGGTIRIVSSLPRTGSARGQTNTIVNGIQMAIEECGGKINNFKIEYSDWDDATAATGSWDGPTEKANAQKAIADPDVMAYIGPYNSNAAKISMPELNGAEPAGLVQISPAVTWPGLTKKIPGVAPDEPEKYRPAKRITFCRVCTTDDFQGPLAADFAKEELKAKKVYVLNDKELYGEGLAKLFKQRCDEIGLETVGEEGIDTTAIEFGGLMAKIKGLNPDLVYFGGTTQSKGGQIAKDMVKAGLTCPMIAPDGCYEKAFIESAGAANLNNRVYVTIVGLDPKQLTGKGAEFVKRYKAKYNTDPEAFAIYGYECARVVLEAIKKVNKKDRAEILKAVLGTKDFTAGAIGGDKGWSFDRNGDTTLRQVTVSRVENGDFVPKKTVTK